MLDPLSLYVGLMVGITVGMLIVGILINRASRKPEWFHRFERDCVFIRKQSD